jgi:hypothetical protein
MLREHRAGGLEIDAGVEPDGHCFEHQSKIARIIID